MSHEIRTPMNGVVGMAEILAQAPLPEEQADAVQVILDSGRSLLRLIDDILDFSKIEAGRVELEHIPVFLAPLLDGVCDPLVPRNDADAAQLRLFISPALPAAVVGDPTRLRQLLFNLVGNAIKFSQEAGRQGRVDVRLLPSEGTPALLQVEVRDNGIGMSPTTISGLFTAFSQAEASTTRRFGGTGLGLAICHRLVSLMEGRIDVASTLGEGSTFTVRLPLRPAPGAAAATGPDLRGVNCVLITERDQDHADLATTLIGAGAFTVRADGLDHAQALVRELGTPVVVVHDAPPADLLQQLPARFQEADAARHLLISHGRRTPARILSPTIGRIGALRQMTLLRGVAMMAGRASPEGPPGAESPGTRNRVDEAHRPLILVAEDDAVNQKVILRQLALLGYDAEVADNGFRALEKWRSGRFDLLLTDLHMPGMDGYTLARQLRAQEMPGQRLPLLGLTANALKGEAHRALEAGLDECLTKPIAIELLRSTLQRWLHRPAAPSAVAAPAPVERGEPAALDLESLCSMVGDDPAVVRELLAEFLHASVRIRHAMQEALERGDAAEVGQWAHRLKSSARAFGARALGDQCELLERTAGRQRAAELAPHWARFAWLVERTQAECRRRLEDQPPGP
jgi:CheY-like chemotaxis protein/HPt (histidine-containing phosphotransfer) domain-containing protein